MSAPEDADAARIAKVEAGRKRMLEKSTEKYCFKVEPLSAPEALIVENGRLVGLRFRRTKMENGKLGMTDERFEARGPVVLSSIGSIPEPIDGHRDEGRALRLQGLGDRTPRGLPDGLLRGQRRHRQGQHRRLAQTRDAGLRGGRRGLPRRRRRRPRGGRRRSRPASRMRPARRTTVLAELGHGEAARAASRSRSCASGSRSSSAPSATTTTSRGWSASARPVSGPSP